MGHGIRKFTGQLIKRNFRKAHVGIITKKECEVAFDCRRIEALELILLVDSSRSSQSWVKFCLGIRGGNENVALEEWANKKGRKKGPVLTLRAPQTAGHTPR